MKSNIRMPGRTEIEVIFNTVGIFRISVAEPAMREPKVKPMSAVNQINAEAKFMSLDLTLSPMKAAVGAVLEPQAAP